MTLKSSTLIEDMEKMIILIKTYPDKKANWLLGALLAAVRGPDSGDDNLKRCSTARIRYLAFPNYQGMTNDHKPNPNELIVLKNLIHQAQPHFIFHYEDAIHALYFLGLMSEEEFVELTNMIKGIKPYLPPNLATRKFIYQDNVAITK